MWERRTCNVAIFCWLSPRRRWEDNIKMDLQEVGGGCGDWMELAQDRDRWRALVSTAMNFRVPKMRGISWVAAELVSFSRRTLLHGVSKFPIVFLLVWSTYIYQKSYFHPLERDLPAWTKRNVYRILFEESTTQRPYGIFRRRWG